MTIILNQQKLNQLKQKDYELKQKDQELKEKDEIIDKLNQQLKIQTLIKEAGKKDMFKIDQIKMQKQ